GDTFPRQDLRDLLCRLLEQPDTGTDGAAHSRIAREDMIFMQPRTIEPMMACRGSEVPNPGIAGAGEEAIANQLVARPLTDNRARGIKGGVLIKTEHTD